MTPNKLAEVAARQLADYDAHQPGSIFASGALSLTIQEAYEIQIEVARLRQRRGEQVAGYKIGCISEAIRRQLGIEHAVFGHLFASEIHPSGARLDPAQFDQLGIEGEFALRLANDITDASGRLEESIAAVFPVIELHNCVFRGGNQAAVELVANNAIHAGIVVPNEPADGAAFGARSITVLRNGEVLGSATVDVLATLPDLVQRLSSHRIQLKKGNIVLTGSPLPLYETAPGDRFEVRADGLVKVEVTVR